MRRSLFALLRRIQRASWRVVQSGFGGGKMKRRDFIFGFGSTAFCFSAARGQQNLPIAASSTNKKRMALVVPSTKVEDLQADPNIKLLFDELKRLDHIEGENLIVERYSGEGRVEQYQSLALAVVATKPD